MKVAAFATIKMNSQRVPHKNIQPIGSRPLCYHIVHTALQIEKIDDVYVYCSDEAVIDYIPKEAKFLKREPWLDGDEIRANDTYSAFLKDIDADIYIALCTTSPFIQKETLRNALDKVLLENYDSAFTAKRMQTFAWYKGGPVNYDVANVRKKEVRGHRIWSRCLWKPVPFLYLKRSFGRSTDVESVFIRIFRR